MKGKLLKGPCSPKEALPAMITMIVKSLRMGGSFKRVYQFQTDTDMGMFDLAWELEDELSDVIEKLGDIERQK